MRFLARAVPILLAVFLLAPLLTCAIEYRPGEKAAEYLFNHGIGKPWVGGDPPKPTYWSQPIQPRSVRPYASYQIIGYLDVKNGFSLQSDSGEGLQLQPGPGSYPVYGYYSGGRLIGLFIDLEPSSGRVQMHARL